jgi:phage gp46-like protein
MSGNHDLTTLGMGSTDLDLLTTLGYGELGEAPPSPFDLESVDLLKFETELEQAVYISLFTDKRITFDETPPRENDRRGWFGNAIDNSDIGSRLWILQTEKMIDILDTVQAYCLEALQWIIDDQVASEITVNVSQRDRYSVDIETIISKGNNLNKRYFFTWNQLEQGAY